VVFAQTLELLGDLLREHVAGLSATVEYRPTADGDVRDTFADRTHVENTIGYRPTIEFREGLRREVAWAVARRRRA
jgi:nucleoside-diphosphate-sugar epimerase